MGYFGPEPESNDYAADWFGNLFDQTKLREAVVKTLKQKPVDDYNAAEIRAAAYVIVLLGDNFIWPSDHLDADLRLAFRKLQEVRRCYQSLPFLKAIDAELAVLADKIASYGGDPEPASTPN